MSSEFLQTYRNHVAERAVIGHPAAAAVGQADR
jgi:hypothetical protein